MVTALTNQHDTKNFDKTELPAVKNTPCRLYIVQTADSQTADSLHNGKLCQEQVAGKEK